MAKRTNKSTEPMTKVKVQSISENLVRRNLNLTGLRGNQIHFTPKAIQNEIIWEIKVTGAELNPDQKKLVEHLQASHNHLISIFKS